jgi:hypothetical protein
MPKPKQQAEQSQASLTDQLRELVVLAHKAGLYDAADWIRGRAPDLFDSPKSKVNQ